MQLMPATARRFGVGNCYNVEQNIRGGTEYLAWLNCLFRGDLRLAVAAYLTGEARVLPKGLAYASPQVSSYVSQVASLYRQKKQLPRGEAKRRKE
jgi:soluble lytic murein transglycosylase-like protein